MTGHSIELERIVHAPVERVLWTLFGRLGAKATEKVMKKDLEDIAAQAEQGTRPR